VLALEAAAGRRETEAVEPVILVFSGDTTHLD